MTRTLPPLPRRAFLAVAAAAATAAALTGLGVVGSITTPETGTFRFARGTQFASGEEARLRAHLASAAKDQRITVVITGHTGTQGNEQANIALSEQRAAAAAGLAQSMGILPANIRAGGAGGGAPLPKQDGMSDRSHQSALARVEVALQVRW